MIPLNSSFFLSFFTVSILIFVFIGILVVSEFWYYRAVETKYDYEVDTDTERCVPVMADQNTIYPYILTVLSTKVYKQVIKKGTSIK